VRISHGSDSDPIQVYPIAFIEFHKDPDGKVTREGPRREKDELAAHDAWTVSPIPDLILSFHLTLHRRSAIANTNVFERKQTTNASSTTIGLNASKPSLHHGIREKMVRVLNSTDSL
jgi:hypothetical protein